LCSNTSREKLIEEYVCTDYSDAEEADLTARLIVIKDFGPWALWYENPLSNMETINDPSVVKPVQRRRKRNG